MKITLSLIFAFLLSNSFSAAIPLKEHPRPDWERPQWQNLNGEWDFGFAAGKYDRKIVVPFGWGSKLSGVKNEGDTGYYRRMVTIPEAWKGKRVFVVVGASDHDTTCTFAGNEVGDFSGGYVPFEFELTEFVEWGKAQPLEFKVWDPNPTTAMGGHYLYGKQGYGNVRGIWQTVYLEARGDVYFEEARFMPSIASGSVTAALRLSAPAKEMKSAAVKMDGKTTLVEFAPGEMVKSVVIPLVKPRLWTLEEPNLYDVELTFGNDEIKSYFGFREIGVGKNQNGDAYVTLNGKPIYLQLCLDQSYHPDGFYTFPSDEFMKEEILISKKLALSGNRIHIKVEVPRKLYWADKLGLLIQADVPCAWGNVSEKMFEEHWKCFEGMVKRDFNHPCIYQWTLFNETWGLFSNRSLEMGLASGKGKKRVYREQSQRAVANCYRKAKALDPTRLVEDQSPCNRDHVVTDVNSWHAYAPGVSWEGLVARQCADNVLGSRNNFIGGNVQRGEPMMNSECGNVWGYTGSAGDCDFTWDYHLMINAFRRHLKCAGWLYTEHHDVINEWNGYVRFDRTWKESGFEDLAEMSLADLHRDAAVFFTADAKGKTGQETGRFVSEGEKLSIPVGVSLVTEKYAGKILSLVVCDWYFDGLGKKQYGSCSMLPKKIPAKSWQNEVLWNFDFTVPSSPSAGVIVFKLMADGKEIARNFWSFATKPRQSSSDFLGTIVASNWSGGTTNVLSGLKYNGFGKGFVEFVLSAPAAGGTFVAELSAKRKNAKDFDSNIKKGIDWMLGGGALDRSKNRNSYPQTSAVDKFPAKIKVFVNGSLAKETVLPDDPADSRGILSWFSQPPPLGWSKGSYLYEAGSYGYLVEVPVAAKDVKDGKVRIKVESDNGLGVYSEAFGRYPLSPSVR